MRIEYKCWEKIIIKSLFVLLTLFIVRAGTGSFSFLSIITAGFLNARSLYSSLCSACIPLFLMKTWHLTREQRWELMGPRHPATADPNSLKFSRIIAAGPHSWTDQVWLRPAWTGLEVFIFHRIFLNFGTLLRDLSCLDFQEEVVSIDSVMVDL